MGHGALVQYLQLKVALLGQIATDKHSSCLNRTVNMEEAKKLERLFLFVSTPRALC
jgi:hypothetical protein